MENNVNQRIIQIRTYLNLSQNDFAVKCGLTQTGIWGIESNGAKPRKATLEKIAQVFGVDREWLLNGVGEMRFSEPQTVDSNPWKDALVNQLKDENSFLKEQISMMREMIQLLKPNANFLNGNDTAGLMFQTQSFDA